MQEMHVTGNTDLELGCQAGDPACSIQAHVHCRVKQQAESGRVARQPAAAAIPLGLHSSPAGSDSGSARDPGKAGKSETKLSVGRLILRCKPLARRSNKRCNIHD